MKDVEIEKAKDKSYKEELLSKIRDKIRNEELIRVNQNGVVS